jgi:hypothetical protein
VDLSEQICYTHSFLAAPKERTLTGEGSRPVACSQLKRVLRGHAYLAALGTTLALLCSPAAAKYKSRHRHWMTEHAVTEHAATDPLANVPKGPLQMFISIDQQRLHFYSGGAHIADAPVATGVPDHPTPRGVFDVIQRDRYHTSNIYSDAPMPYMERITWSGVALHEGEGVGHEASHGCIRMPHYFAERLWHLPTMGMRVVITRPELRPAAIADPHLFVHRDRPMPFAPPTAQVAAAQTDATKTDAGQLGSAPAGTGAADEAAMPANTTASGEQTGPAPVANSMSAAISLDDLPYPPAKPEQLVRSENAPIAIFVSRKLGKIFVRQDFEPVFESPVKIDKPDEPLGTHVFTALNYLPDHATLQWNVVSLPVAPKKVRWTYVTINGWRKRVRVKEDPSEVPQTPQEALARITIPQDAIDQISQLVVPGSSLVISDQGLGDETGKGTDFIVVEP